MPDKLGTLVRNIEALVHKQEFDAVCKLFSELDAARLPASLLLEKSRAIQLAHNPAGLTLDDARDSLLLATDVEPECLQAWVDLGHFYLSVDNHVARSLKAFRKARALVETLTKDLDAGEVRAFERLQQANRD